MMDIFSKVPPPARRSNYTKAVALSVGGACVLGTLGAFVWAAMDGNEEAVNLLMPYAGPLFMALLAAVNELRKESP